MNVGARQSPIMNVIASRCTCGAARSPPQGYPPTLTPTPSLAASASVTNPNYDCHCEPHKFDHKQIMDSMGRSNPQLVLCFFEAHRYDVFFHFHSFTPKKENIYFIYCLYNKFT